MTRKIQTLCYIVRVAPSHNGQSEMFDYLVKKSDSLQKRLQSGSFCMTGCTLDKNTGEGLSKLDAINARKPFILVIYDWREWGGNTLTKQEYKDITVTKIKSKFKEITDDRIHSVELLSLSTNFVAEVDNASDLISYAARNARDEVGSKAVKGIIDLRKKYLPCGEKNDYSTSFPMKEFKKDLEKLPFMEANLIRYFLTYVRLNGTMEYLFTKGNYEAYIAIVNCGITTTSKYVQTLGTTSKKSSDKERSAFIYRPYEVLSKLIDPAYWGMDEYKEEKAEIPFKTPPKKEATPVNPLNDEEDLSEDLSNFLKLYREVTGSNYFSKDKLKVFYEDLSQEVRNDITSNISNLSASSLRAKVDILASIEKNMGAL